MTQSKRRPSQTPITLAPGGVQLRSVRVLSSFASPAFTLQGVQAIVTCTPCQACPFHQVKVKAPLLPVWHEAILVIVTEQDCRLQVPLFLLVHLDGMVYSCRRPVCRVAASGMSRAYKTTAAYLVSLIAL